MKKIRLSGLHGKGKFTMVDDADYEWLNGYSWHYSKGYARNWKNQWMQRVILNTPIGLESDHINGDRLDNRRENLRIVTKQQNMINRKKHIQNKTGYKGVSWDNRMKKYMGYITFNNRGKRLGHFETAYEAHIAYQKKARELFGEYRRI